MKRVLQTLAAVAMIGTAGAAGAATIINGSFEDGVAIPDGGFVSLTGGSTAITGWTVGDQSFGIDYVGTYWQAADGERSVDLSLLNTGTIWQDIDTVVGQTYTVRFFIAGNPDGLPVQKGLTVSIFGEQPQYETFDITGRSRDNMGWEARSFTFTAFGSTSRLMFSGNTRTPFGAAIDNVSIELGGGGNPLPIPEPATWAMLIAGFGLVGATQRRRRRTVVAA